MTEQEANTDDPSLEIDLRDPKLAALLAWLWPGAGHLYQRRFGKGFLFMVCIVGTYLFGLAMGGGHVVYASWQPNDHRWQYFCQLGVGIPAMPAIVQTMRVKSGKAPFFAEAYYRYSPLGVPGAGRFEKIDSPDELDPADELYIEAPMAPPGKVIASEHDLLAKWHEEHHALFDLGTLFTVIAGLLNVLVVYDAYAGPIAAMHDSTKDRARSNHRKKNEGAR